MAWNNVVEAWTRAYIKQNEGLILQWYKDSLGYPTVGYGHLITADERGSIPAQLTLAQAESLFSEDFHEALEGAKTHPAWSDTLADGRLAALVDLTFNMGKGWIRAFFNTTKDLVEGNYEGAAKGLLQSQYARQVGLRANRNSYLLRTGLLPAVPAFDPSHEPTPAQGSSPTMTEQYVNPASPMEVGSQEVSPTEEVPPTEAPTSSGFSPFSPFGGFSSFGGQ